MENKTFAFPSFTSSDSMMNEVYDYRVRVFNRHIRQTPEGYVVTEFLPDVSWAGAYNSINCAASHHIRDGRWMADNTVVRDYLRFWLTGSGSQRSYSFPAADSLREYVRVTGDTELARELYGALKENYAGWRAEKGRDNGMFFQIDDRDGMEYSISGNGFRPTINSYMQADAAAVAYFASLFGQEEDAKNYQEEADRLREQINAVLWNEEHRFYETVHEDGECSRVREEIGYIPWMYAIPPQGREDAFDQLWDKDGFFAPYGPTTAERRHPDYRKPFPHECLWNGPSWPFATTQTLCAMLRAVQDAAYPATPHVTASDFMRLLGIYTVSQHEPDGRPYIDENLDPDTGVWLARDLLIKSGRSKDRGVDYHHSGYMDLIIRGVCGLIPSDGNVLTVHPLGTSLKHFSLTGLNYRGHAVGVVWQDGRLTVTADGRSAESDGSPIALTLEN